MYSMHFLYPQPTAEAIILLVYYSCCTGVYRRLYTFEEFVPHGPRRLLHQVPIERSRVEMGVPGGSVQGLFLPTPGAATNPANQ